MKTPKMAKITAMDLRSLRAELKEEHEWRLELHREVAVLKADLARAGARGTIIAQIMEAEKARLLGRLGEIDLILGLFERQTHDEG